MIMFSHFLFAILLLLLYNQYRFKIMKGVFYI